MKSIIVFFLVSFFTQLTFAGDLKLIQKTQESLNRYFENYILAPDTQYIMFWKGGALEGQDFPLSVDYRQNPSYRHCILKLKNPVVTSSVAPQIKIVSIEQSVPAKLPELTAIQQARYERSRRRGDQAFVLRFNLQKNSSYESFECFERSSFATVFRSPSKNTVLKMLR